MPIDPSRRQQFDVTQSGRTQNAAADAPVAPPWVALAIFSVVNAIAGILILIFLGHSTSLVTGFTACLVFLGISYLGWLAAGIGLWKKDRSEEHTSELQSRPHLVCRLLLEKKKSNCDS